MFLSRAETMLPMYANNPEQLVEAIALLGTQFVVHRTLVLINIFYNYPTLLTALPTFVAGNPVYSLGLIASAAAAPAPASGFTGLAGLAGMAAPAASPAAVVPAPVATLSNPPVTPPAPAVASAVTPTFAPGPGPAPPPPPWGAPTAPPPFTGTEGGPATDTLALPYLVGGLPTDAESRTPCPVRRPTSAAAAAPSAAAASDPKPDQTRQRRRAAPGHIDRGYRYEFLDADSVARAATVDPDETSAAEPTGQGGAGPLGFAGTASGRPGQPASGLTTLAGDNFGNQSTAPMLPGNWQSGSEGPGSG